MIADVIAIAPRCACALCAGDDYEFFRRGNLDDVRAKLRGDASQLTEAYFAARWHTEHARRSTAEQLRIARVCEALPARAWRVSRHEFANSQPMQQLRDWHLADGCIAILAGPSGAGKTVASTRLAFEHYDNPMFVTASTWARWSRFGEERAAVLKHIECAGELILDDLGVEVLDRGGVLLADLDELIDKIYSGCHQAVITTNCTLAAFKKRYGARVVDRLAECGEWIPFVGPSKRGAKR